MSNNKPTISIDKMSQLFMVWFTGVTNRLRVLGKAIRYGMVAEVAELIHRLISIMLRSPSQIEMRVSSMT